jgi:two-component system, cell cycle sensor histidine kinase and response regulator CckA
MKLTIRWSLIIGFLCLIWGTYAVTTTSTFVSSQKTLNGHAMNIMENIADLAMEKSQNHLVHAHGAAVLTRRLIAANVVSVNENSIDSLEHYFLDQLAIYSHFAGIYLGKPNGDFFYVSRNGQRSPGGFRTKIISHREGVRATALTWRDQNMNILSEESAPQDRYDPRVRPWYKKALENEKIVWSDPYVFYTSQKPGITIAGPTYDESGALKGIVGVDIEIDELSIFIGNLKIGQNGRAFMINNTGEVVAFPDLEKIKTQGSTGAESFRLVKIDELDAILSRKAFSAVGLIQDKQGRFVLKESRFARFEHEGRYHHAMLTPFSIPQWPWIIGVHLPEDDYLGDLKKSRLFNILLTLAISIVATIIALYFARSIIRPITNLEKEALAVKNDDMQMRFNINSKYKEIQETADSFRLMKEAIRKSREKYRGIFENIQDTYYETSLEGEILEMSPSIERISPYNRKDLLGVNVDQLYFSPRDREEMIGSLLADKKISDYEILLKFENDEPVYISLNSELITDEQGSPLKIVGSMRDITARKKVEAELHNYREHLEELVQERTADLEKAGEKLKEEMHQRLQTELALGENKEKYRNILESIEEGYFETDLSGNFTFYNDATSRILGWLKRELPGMNIRNYTSRETAQRLFLTFKEVYRTGNPCGAIEFEIIRKDRSNRYIEMSVSLVRNVAGEPQGFRGIGRDTTDRRFAENERKRLEEKLQQVERLEAIGTLAGGIAHDFNNLLMGIQGNVDLLLISLDATDPRYENARGIERCVRSGANLTRQLLGYARGGKYFVKPINLNDVVRASSNLFGRAKKETEMICEYQPDIWTVEVDRSQIEQVLVNLFLNAWQAMGHRGTIHVKTENAVVDNDFVRPYEAMPGKYVRVSVGDTGKGMDKGTQKRVFEPFFTTKSMGKGTGMGLASAFGIVKNHNGIIHFTSTLGTGTTFYIYLPASDLLAEDDTTLEEKVRKGSETILVVDDEDYILDACQAMLTKLGYNAILVNNAEEALEMFRKDNDKIDLIILDMVMPGMDGLTAYEHLKEINPDVKVLLSSGYSLTGAVKEILDKGCDEYIQKPFSLSRISRVTRELLDKK